MTENANDLKQLIFREAVRAGIWGITFLVVAGLFIIAIKQEIKEGVDYTVKRFTYEMVTYATDPYIIGKAKQLVKEGIEYSLDKAGNKYEAVMVQTHKSIVQAGQMETPPALKMPTSQ